MLMSPDSSMNPTKILSPVIMSSSSMANMNAHAHAQPSTTSTMHHQSVIRLRCKTPPTYNYQPQPDASEIKSIYQTSPTQGYRTVAPSTTQHHQQVNWDWIQFFFWIAFNFVFIWIRSGIHLSVTLRSYTFKTNNNKNSVFFFS